MEELNIFTKLTESLETDSIGRIIAVRHAESIANTEGRYQGQTYDTDLSELGQKQAKALAQRVKDLGIKRIVSSPLKRTYQTALEISKICDCPVEINELITETNHGKWEGMNKDMIAEKYPEEFDLWHNKPSLVSFPGGESFTDTARRVWDFAVGYEPTAGTLIITHDNILRILVTMANGWTLDEIWKHNIE